jgi:probable F420-dependent oxidoreductase
MEYGFNVPVAGPLSNPADIATVVARGEELGYGLLAIPDHIVVPSKIDSRYPYSQSGEFEVDAKAGDHLEPLALMAHIGGITKKARLLTSVMVVPYRQPVLTAKLVSTIDHLTGGRVVLGIGAGWMAEEFPPVGAPPFEARGRVTDEYIAIYKELWTAEKPKFKGEFTSFDGISFAPKPVQNPHPPIWVGGESRPAKRRAARLGDAWYPIGCNPRHPLDTIERYQASLNELHGMCEKEGRDPATLDLAYWAVWYGAGAQKTDTGERMLLTGNADDIAGDVKALSALGVRHICLQFMRASVSESLDAMTEFAEEVMPKTGA